MPEFTPGGGWDGWQPSGALGEIRTPDPRIRSPMLYPAELRARAWVDYQTWPDRASSLLPGRPGRRAGLWRRRDRSEAGMSAAVLAEIGRSTLPAGIGRRAIVIGERAGLRSGPVIMAEADRVEQSIGVKGGPRLRQAGCGGQRGQDCSGREELQAGHLEISGN